MNTEPRWTTLALGLTVLLAVIVYHAAPPGNARYMMEVTGLAAWILLMQDLRDRLIRGRLDS